LTREKISDEVMSTFELAQKVCAAHGEVTLAPGQLIALASKVVELDILVVRQRTQIENLYDEIGDLRDEIEERGGERDEC
jgi:hypothetical protein